MKVEIFGIAGKLKNLLILSEQCYYIIIMRRLHSYLIALSLERRRSSDSSVEGEEDKLNRNYFPNSKTESRRSSSNGIDCKFFVLSRQKLSQPWYFMV